MDNLSLDQYIVSVDVEVNFSKQALDLFFNFENRKAILPILKKNNYKKLRHCLINEFIIHNCLMYTIHYSLDKLSKKIIREYYGDNKMDINRNKSEIFKFAVYYKKSSLIPLLISYGCDVSTDENYALIQFCLMGNISIVKLLIEKGTDIYARNSLALIQAASNNKIDIVNLLLTQMKKRQIDFLEDYCVTNYDLALISATHAGNNEIVEILLSAGADPSVHDSEVLIVSAKNGNSQLVKIFLDYGIDPNTRNGLALEEASKNGHYSVVKELIEFQNESGDYVCDLSNDNSVALRFAALRGHYSIVELLIGSLDTNGIRRCDPNAENSDALRLARKYGHIEIVKLLEKA